MAGNGDASDITNPESAAATGQRMMIADQGEHSRNIIDTLSRAFVDDPGLSFLKPDPVARRAMLPAFFTHMRREDLLVGKVETSPGGEVAALWRAPGHHKDEPLGSFRTSLAFLRILGLATPRGITVGASMAKHHPQAPHWYLRFLGVRPEAQGKGWGGVALRHGIARAEADGLPIYLETATPENVGLYRRFGFAITQEWDVPSGGPHFWGMMRR
jgi:ribosomal protein S18 acetylase RimI-like enzyme